MLKEKPACIFNKHESPVTCCILSPLNEMLMISGGLDNQLSCYDLKQKSYIKSTIVYGGITCIDMNKDGSTIAVGTANGYVNLFDLRSKIDEPMHSFKAHSSVHCLKFLYEIPVAPKQEDLTTTINKRVNNLITTPVNDQSSSTTTQYSFINMYSPTNEHNKQSSTALSGINSSFVLHKNNDSITSPIKQPSTPNGVVSHMPLNKNLKSIYFLLNNFSF
jgi:WD40 repeat protein